MLITFRTQAYGDVTMFGDVALRLIGLMGHSETVPGAIKSEDIPEALRKLKAAVAQQPEPREGDADAGEEDDQQDRVDLARRAYPLIQQLEAAEKADCDVLWDK